MRERQESVRARDGQFCSLASRGKEQVHLFFVLFFLIYALENMKNGHVHRMFQKCFYQVAAAGESDIVLTSKVLQISNILRKIQIIWKKLSSMFCENHQPSLFFLRLLSFTRFKNWVDVGVNSRMV